MSGSGQRHTGGRTARAAHVSRILRALGYTPHNDRRREGIRVSMLGTDEVRVSFDFDLPDPDRPAALLQLLTALIDHGYIVCSMSASAADAGAVVRKGKA